MRSSNTLWQFFISVRLTIGLLLSLAATSIIGTLIPQNKRQADYFHEYGEFLFNLFYKFDLFDMYHAWWFQLLLLLLGINIVACSIDRLSKLWKTIFVKNPKFSIETFRKLSHKKGFNTPHGPDKLTKAFLPILSRAFGFTKVEDTESGACIFAEKRRWTRIGVYVVHLSVMFLLAGSLVGSIFGFDAFVNIPEGETVNTVFLRNSNRELTLDFEIRCDDFEMSLYENGAPKEYRSRLSILENKTVVFKKDIIVNDPLHYKGINIYQSSYGKLPPAAMHSKKTRSFSGADAEPIVLNFTSTESGMAYTQKTTIGETIDLPEGLGTLTINEYRPAADFSGHNIGEALVGTYAATDAPPVDVLLPFKFPNFDRMRGGKIVISIADQAHETFSPSEETEARYYTGLQVTNDPGVWIVYTGFIMMIVGCIITFFMSHQRVCVELTTRGKKTSVTVTGTSNKNKFAMENTVSRLAGKLEGAAGRV